MKKSLIALAVLAVSGTAMAQSSVTLFGVVDAAIQHGSGDIADRTRLVQGAYNSSRLGFRGVEDLGGGMSASFWLEAGLNNDDGSGQATNSNNQATGATGGGGLTFNRRSTVSLSGNFGEVRLGRDYTPQFWNLTIFDPFGTVGVGSAQTLATSFGGPVNVRASNSIGYFLPKMGGFYGQVQYYMGENLKDGAATEKDGTGLGFRVGYAAGPLNVAVAYSNTDYAAFDEVETVNVGGSYDFGVVKLMAHYNSDKQELGAEGRGYLIGAHVPVGAGQIRVSWAHGKIMNDFGPEPEAKKIALGYVYNLSKRTALYTTYSRVKNENGATAALGGAVVSANKSSNGYDFGIRHSF